jgi:hypothetical protein
MKLYQQPGIAARRFARLERNDMWQAEYPDNRFIPIFTEDALL